MTDKKQVIRSQVTADCTVQQLEPKTTIFRHGTSLQATMREGACFYFDIMFIFELKDSKFKMINNSDNYLIIFTLAKIA